MDKQEKMFSKFEQTGSATESVEQYEFEPIQGYPMLHWKGKRPFRSTQYYPAQLKESYGEPVDGWINRIYWGDNLQVMSHLLKEFRGRIELVYIDPPFDSNAEYKKKIKMKGDKIENDINIFEEKQYTDIWTNDEYLQFIYERIVLIRELLSDSGSIYVHCDHRKSHHLRCILDEIFGPNQFRNQIIREKCNPKNYTNSTYGNISDIILFYSKTDNNIWETLYQAILDDDIENAFPKIHSNGKRYKTSPLHAPGIRSGETGRPWRGIDPPSGNHWRYIHNTLDELDEAGLIEWSDTGNPRKIIFVDESKGIPLQDIWLGMKDTATNYPTEKNPKFIKRIIQASTKPGDIVFDCFMGSGTTQATAMDLGRRFIGADINFGAVQITTKRLLSIIEKIIKAKPKIDVVDEQEMFTSFSVYNVNHYDIFRNPVQAKDLLIEALEIQPIPYNTVYDGEKDGRMVKIMPVNRIATRADLNELISNFDYKKFEKRKSEQPNKAVEKILLVCMGHEPDLAGVLEKEAGYKLDVEVVDILRDKSNLEFKRDSEAVVITKNGNIEIQNFYPMNLLQKLSLMKENVADWRELVESVMIDWDFDGETLRPALTDIPGKNELVKGTYPLPKHHGNIRVKITDLLSESWEGGVTNG